MRLWRAHGLGNDYLVLEEGPELDAAAARALCDRHRGPGGDGVLEPVDADGAHGVRIWNPDGSIAEKSGNGLRIFAHWLVHERGAPTELVLDTGHGRVGAVVDGDDVELSMGPATIRWAERALEVEGATLITTAVSVGNPHCVVFRDEPLDGLPWRTWGEALERHELFPQRTNVQIARVAGPRALELRIWERGAGETLSSGTSSCAAAAAAVHTGLLPAGPLAVLMPGGTLLVTVPLRGPLVLRGPVEPICRITGVRAARSSASSSG